LRWNVIAMTERRWGRNEAALGAITAVLLVELTPGLPVWAGYLVFWAPLIVAVVVATRRRHRATASDDALTPIRFRITPMDLLVGAFIGLSLRCVMIAIELLGVGRLTSTSSMFSVDRDLLWFASAIIAPAIIAPIVEELFFRGLVLPAIGANWIGIVGSAAIFSAMHVANEFHPMTAISTFIVGVALGVLAVRTRRLGAGITAHIVYNATLIAMSELGGMAPLSG
jgi:membrane protease YdiL (CAAX protease family)